jgi:hypothetical protein
VGSTPRSPPALCKTASLEMQTHDRNVDLLQRFWQSQSQPDTCKDKDKDKDKDGQCRRPGAGERRIFCGGHA